MTTNRQPDQDIIDYLQLCDEFDPNEWDTPEMQAMDKRMDELADILEERYGAPSDTESGYNYYEDILEEQYRR